MGMAPQRYVHDRPIRFGSVGNDESTANNSALGYDYLLKTLSCRTGTWNYEAGDFAQGLCSVSIR